MYGGVFWNTNDLVDYNDNNVFIKFVSLGSIYSWTDPYGDKGTLIEDQSFVLETRFEYEFVVSGAPKGNTIPLVEESSQKYFPISVSYAGVGTTINIPYGTYNNKIDGNPAYWQLNDFNLSFDDNGDSLDNYWLQGYTKITGAGQTAYIDSDAYVKIGAMYYMGSGTSAQDIILVDSFSLPRITTTIQN